MGPNSLKHKFQIDLPCSSSFIESPKIFNLHNFAEICFMYRYESSVCYFKMKTKKHTLANDSKITLRVIGGMNDHFDSTRFICTEQWSEPLFMGYTTHAKHSNIEVEFHITVNKTDSMVAKLYEDEDFIDFHLSSGGGIVAVHRTVLAAHSDVFKTMLSQEWKETTEGRLQIEGVTLKTLQHLKQYMYLGTLPDDGLRPLLQIAMCYLMNNLKLQCLMKLAHSVTAENLHEMLEYSFLNKIPELTFAILEMMPIGMVEQAREMTLKNEPDQQINGKSKEKANKE